MNWNITTTAALIVSALCSSAFAAYGPIEDPQITPQIFLEPYRKALKSIDGSSSDIFQRELVQLCLPTPNSIKIWYALGKNADSQASLNITSIDENGTQTQLPQSKLQRVFNKTYHTGTIEVLGLSPGKRYTFQIEGGGLNISHRISAMTKPAGKSSFSFIAGSCFLPWSYADKNRTFITNETVAVLRSFQARANAADEHRPAFYLGLGDQIYVDPGAKDHAVIAYLYGKHSEMMRGTVSTSDEVLDGLYRYHFGLKPLALSLASIPSAMMWDDHDIRDGWGSQLDEDTDRWIEYYDKAKEAFFAFQASRNPGFRPPENGHWVKLAHADNHPEAARKTEQNFSFSWGPGEFFVVDGRSARNFRERRSMSLQQIGAVGKWLEGLEQRKDDPLVYVFCFPVPLAGGEAVLPSWSAQKRREDSDDSRERAWVIPEERDILLNALLNHAKRFPKHRLVILSGDVHYSGIQVLREPNTDNVTGKILGYEIVSSGLAQTEFNDKGPYWATVARPIGEVIVNDHGYYAGPSFAELFISLTSVNEAPEVKVLFYPAAERPVRGFSRLKHFSTLNLNVDWIDSSFAKRPEDYPQNTKGFSPLFFIGRSTTKSHLAEHIILDQWLKSGRATRGGIPDGEALSW